MDIVVRLLDFFLVVLFSRKSKYSQKVKLPEHMDKQFGSILNGEILSVRLYLLSGACLIKA